MRQYLQLLLGLSIVQEGAELFKAIQVSCVGKEEESMEKRFAFTQESTIWSPLNLQRTLSAIFQRELLKVGINLG